VALPGAPPLPFDLSVDLSVDSPVGPFETGGQVEECPVREARHLDSLLRRTQHIMSARDNAPAMDPRSDAFKALVSTLDPIDLLYLGSTWVALM